MKYISFSSKLSITPTTFIQKIVEWIASILSMIYFSTPLIQIIKMYKGQLKPEHLPLTLLLSILLNCTFWILHGITTSIIEKKIWWSLLICNFYGLIINITLLFLFLYIYLEKNIKNFLGYGLFVINILIEISYLIEIWVLKKGKRNDEYNNLIGGVATIFNVCMYLSPATNIIRLLQNESYEFLPIFTNIVGFITTLVWLVYGILTFDSKNDSAKYTLYSNSFSVFIVTIQIIFWIYYFIHSIYIEDLNYEINYKNTFIDNDE